MSRPTRTRTWRSILLATSGFSWLVAGEESRQLDFNLYAFKGMRLYSPSSEKRNEPFQLYYRKGEGWARLVASPGKFSASHAYEGEGTLIFYEQDPTGLSELPPIAAELEVPEEWEAVSVLLRMQGDGEQRYSLLPAAPDDFAQNGCLFFNASDQRIWIQRGKLKVSIAPGKYFLTVVSAEDRFKLDYQVLAAPVEETAEVEVTEPAAASEAESQASESAESQARSVFASRVAVPPGSRKVVYIRNDGAKVKWEVDVLTLP